MLRVLSLLALIILAVLTLIVDLYFLEHVSPGSINETRRELWLTSFVIYLIIMIPPFFMFDTDRKEKAEMAIASGFSGILTALKYIGIGFLFYTGWHIATNVL